MQRDVKGQMAQIDRHRNMVSKNCIRFNGIKKIRRNFCKYSTIKTILTYSKTFSQKIPKLA
jgi:small nuclear ribonucleoprotein (snRNP)-like protein